MDDYIDIHDESECPECGHIGLRSKSCDNIFCEDGRVSMYEYDAINYSPSEYSVCEECHGSTVTIWCSGCNANLSGRDVLKEDKFINQLP